MGIKLITVNKDNMAIYLIKEIIFLLIRYFNKSSWNVIFYKQSFFIFMLFGQ